MPKVLVKSVSSPEPEFRLVENPLGLTPSCLLHQVEGYSRTYFGTMDLLKLAGYVLSHGYDIDDFEVSDANLYPVDDDTQEEIRAELLDGLRSRGVGGALEIFMDRHPTFSVTGIELIDDSDHGLIVRRDGIIDAEEDARTLDMLSDAWREIRFR